MRKLGGTTRKQRELLAFITDCIKETGVAPSFDEMKEKLGLASKSGVHRLVHSLAERGHIEVMPNRARAIFLPGGSEGDAEFRGACMDAIEATVREIGPITDRNAIIAGVHIAQRLSRLGARPAVPA